LAATRCSAVCHSSVRVLSCSVTWSITSHVRSGAPSLLLTSSISGEIFITSSQVSYSLVHHLCEIWNRLSYCWQWLHGLMGVQQCKFCAWFPELLLTVVMCKKTAPE
jgi:hypothetical protein